MRSFQFELVNEITPKCETFPLSMLDFEHEFVCEDVTKTTQRMQKLKHEGDIGGNQGSKHFKHLFLGAKAFIKATKKGDAFFVYVIPTFNLGM
jgi:hypothetical protein